MKKLLLVPVMLALLAARAYSFSIDIGVHGGAAWWDPYFREWVSGDHELYPFVATAGRNYSIDPTWQIGPELTFTFTDAIRWRNTYTYSKFEADASYLMSLFFGSLRYFNITQRIERHTLESTLDYSVHKYVSVLAGFKYQNYKDKKKDLGISSASLSASSWESVYNGLGFGAGIGVRFDIVKDLSVNLDARFIYIKPLLNMKRDALLLSSPYLIKTEFNPDYHCPGMDADLSLAYYIKPASLTIALGCKYQYLYTLGNNADITLAEMIYFIDILPRLLHRSDHQVDLYLSAVYTVDFSKNEPAAKKK